MTHENLTQKAYTAVLNHFVATGRAPHYVELAEKYANDQIVSL